MEKGEIEVLLECLYVVLQKIKKIIERSDECKAIENQEPYISLTDFFFQNKICHSNTMARLLSTDERFFNACAKFENRRYLVKPMAVLNYLSVYGSDKMKKRINDLLVMKQTQKPFHKPHQPCYC